MNFERALSPRYRSNRMPFNLLQGSRSDKPVRREHVDGCTHGRHAGGASLRHCGAPGARSFTVAAWFAVETAPASFQGRAQRRGDADRSIAEFGEAGILR